MVVTSGIERAIQYFHAIRDYLLERKSPYRAIVAFSRRAFFSFRYEGDIWRASQVRNSWVTKPDRETAGFWDAASWEEVKKKGQEAIERWINTQLNGTSVTVILIGAD